MRAPHSESLVSSSKPSLALSKPAYRSDPRQLRLGQQTVNRLSSLFVGSRRHQPARLVHHQINFITAPRPDRPSTSMRSFSDPYRRLRIALQHSVQLARARRESSPPLASASSIPVSTGPAPSRPSALCCSTSRHHANRNETRTATRTLIPSFPYTYKGAAMAHQHPPRFLKIVDDAKSRVRETNVDEVKSRMDRGDKLLARRCARRKRIRQGPSARRDSSGQRHYRARHRSPRARTQHAR